jgi:REP element-mobilizing transposase RayT
VVVAYHVVITAYGFWLPNDPRGSGSDYVRRAELLQFGSATYVDTRKSVARTPVSREQRAASNAAKDALLYPAVRFDDRQINAIGDGFADGVHRSNYVFYACAILRDHTHLVIRRHTYPIEQVINRLKGSASRVLAERDIHPLGSFRDPRGRIPSPWSAKSRKVFLNTPADVARCVGYAQNNLARAGFNSQKWDFVREYNA